MFLQTYLGEGFFLIKLRKWIIALLISFCLIVSGAMPVSAVDAALTSTDVEQFLDAVINQHMREFNIPNLTVSVVRGEEVIFAKGYGFADILRQVPVDPAVTLFRIGSTSKLLTWTAVMQLVEEGKLDLDTDINHYLDFEIPARLVTKRGYEPAPITLKDLMTHTAGFEAYSINMYALSQDKLPSLEEYVRRSLPARVFPPGEVPAYSNYGTSLAGYIVQQVSGMPFAQYIEEHIYKPLGMQNSTFRQPLPRALEGNLAQAYRYIDGEFREGKFEYMSEPAGSMSSTALDMARFMIAHLQGGQAFGGRILGEETARRMANQLYTYHPQLDGMAHGFIQGTFNERPVLYHPGGTMLFDTGLYMLPQEEVGFFISHSGGNALVNLTIFQAFMDRYFPGESSPPTVKPGDVSREFAGEYHLNRRSFTTSDKFLTLLMDQVHVTFDAEGYLVVNNMGRAPRFVQVEPGVFRNIDYEPGDFRTIVFGVDPLGKTILVSDGPISYSMAHWYETGGINLLMIILPILFILGTMMSWTIAGAVQILQRKKSPRPATKGEKTAKALAIGYGVFTLIFVAELVLANQVDPVYQFPAEAYSEQLALTPVLSLVPWAMGILGLAVTAFAVIAWCKGYWRVLTRVHFTFFALATLLLLRVFLFFNVIGF